MSRNKPNNPIIFKGIFSNIRLSAGLLVCCIFLFSFHVRAIDEIIEINIGPVISFDDVPVDFVVNSNLRFETDVIITESNNVYININELFENLGIKCISQNEGNNLIGFIENENKTYNIDFNAKHITIGNRIIQSANGIIKESGAIYVESTVITEAFGLNIIFNYRSLSIKLETNFELPVIKQIRLEQMRQNVSKLQSNQIIADTIVDRDYHFLKFGTMDWAVSSYQTTGEKINNRFYFGVGTELLYGQANVSVYYNDKYEFDNRNINYNWRWIDNDSYIIKQAQLGKMFTQSIAFLEAPVVGGAVSNAPTTIRKASGYYNITDYTEPNWSVELYINDVLVDFTSADASGLFVFKVPIVYGYTTITLKFYGPMGEERIEERTKNVPFTFLPAKTLEYNVSGGVLQDVEGSRFGKAIVNYGINNFITVGGGFEYLSSIPDYPSIPFATLAFQPFNRMVMNLEYAHNVRMKGLLNYYFGRSAYLEVEYADYVEGQMATRFNADEELKVLVSFPFKKNAFSGFTKLNFNQRYYELFTYNLLNVVFSEYYKNISANLSANLNWTNTESLYFTTNLAASYRLKGGLVFRPSAEYVVTENRFLRFRAEIEKRVSRFYVSVSYEKNLYLNTDNAYVNFKYDLPFARTGISASYSNNKTSFAESAEGSVAFGGSKTVKTNNNSALGKGGILFYPFLDLNQNGKKDKGEQMVLLTNVRVTGGKAEVSQKDSIVRVSDLNAFVDYTVEFSDNDLENIAWRFKHKTYQILVDPNQYKRVDVPIVSVGEISGMVYLNDNNILEGIGRITIEISNKQGNKVAETLSERDGYFSYLGLSPNDYVIRIDEEQLTKLDYESTPLKHNVTIKASVDGDIVDGLDFVLKTKEKREEVSSVQQNTINSSGKVDVIEKIEVIKTVNEPASNLSPAKNSIKANPLPEKKSSNNSILKNIAPQKEAVKTNKIKKDSETINSRNEAKTSSNINTSFGKISDIDGLFYSVQIGVYKNYVTAGQLKNLNPIFYETLPNGNNRYFSGKYNSAEEAEKARTLIVAKGILGAHVVTIQNGVKLAASTPNFKSAVINQSVNENVLEGQDFVENKINENK